MAETKNNKVYSVNDLAESKRFSADRDIITALLDADKKYSIEDAAKIVADFKHSPVKE